MQFYCLDFGGGALGAIRDLPQVGTVTGRSQPDLVRRTVDEMETILARREAVFAEHGIGSMAQYRQLRSAAGMADAFGDVFLVIDGWAGLCRDFDRLEAPVVALAGRGLSFGVHVVLTAARWAEVRPGLRDLIGTRIELRLGDPADSELDRRQADRVPRDRPGRGLTHDGLHMLIAHPDPDGWRPVRHNDIGAPPIPLLPAVLPRHALPCPADRLVLGVDERGTEVVTLDFDRQPHLLIVGDTECGKTSTLRLLYRELIRTARPARLLVVDYRRGLLDLIGSEADARAGSGQPAGYAMSAAALAALLPGLLDILARRMPSAAVTATQLRDRSWWSGPELYVLVDDYDLVATATGSPLAPLLEHLPHARDLGLHLVLARRSGGAARACYEPVLAALRDLGAMGLMMSADPDDGPLIGAARPAPLPAGRGTLVTRAGGERLIQVAWNP